ncbi:MAG TPA: carboxypeptidase-like regulatory domain-containing protein, partial [Saprospiraceae bacterium]
MKLIHSLLRFLPLCAALLICNALTAQQRVTIYGTITDQQDGQPVELVTIIAQPYGNTVNTSEQGKYEITVPPGDTTRLLFRRTGFQPFDTLIQAQAAGKRIQINIALPAVKSDIEVVVTGQKIEDAGTIRENVEGLKLIPSTTGNLESLLPYIALGTTSGTGGELTSQYNVRGGNYDENLVYVNDFEIYRPLLVRSGNQEGLSLPNADLMRDLSFSSGGFEARYGDKMSSVLDVRYKLPDTLRGSFSISLLGATGHLEGSRPVGKDPYRKWRYLLGARYKTSAYLLGSLDVEGEYNPSFTDYQVYTTLDLSRDWQLGLMANLNISKYDFVPVSRETATGLISSALRLSTEFQGAEKDVFTNGMTGLALSYVPDREKNPLFLKFLISGYKSLEQENLDIIGQYRLSQIETSLENPDAGEEIALLGIGTQHVYSRNVLQANILNAEVKYGIEFQQSAAKSNFFQAGIKATYQDMYDNIHEWERLDSAGFSLPYDPEALELLYVLNSERDLVSMLYSGYVQNTYTKQYGGGREVRITGGLRALYSDVNEEFFLSPRVQFAYKPQAHKGFTFSTGWYIQPPFYKELRMPNGEINQGVLSQKSFQVLAGYSAGFGPDGTIGPKYKLIIEA